MSTKVKLFSAASIENLEKQVNKWLDQCESDDQQSVIINSIQIVTYPGASTGLAVLYTIEPYSQEAIAERDRELLRRLLERGGKAVTKQEVPPEQRAAVAAPHPPVIAEMDANERSAALDAENLPTKPCGCTDKEMCRRCDNGKPLDAALAMMVKGLPDGADTDAAARMVGADTDALTLFESSSWVTPVDD